MSDQQIIMKVPEEIITAQVRAAVAAALSRDPTRMIRDVAKEEFAAFVAEQRPLIKKTIQEKLQADKKRLVDGIAEKLANAATTLHVDAYLKE